MADVHHDASCSPSHILHYAYDKSAGSVTERERTRRGEITAHGSDYVTGTEMKFAFLIHPISEQTRNLMDLDKDGRLRNTWGRADVLKFCAEAHAAVRNRSESLGDGEAMGPRVVDVFSGLVAELGGRAEGRLYEIPMDARAILTDPDRALAHMEQAVTDAVLWGARIVGLGSMTGIVGNHGEYLAERHPIAVTTGNSLTVYATVRNLEHHCEDLGIDPGDEEIAIVGVPGSIASAVALLLAPRCRRLVLVARKVSPRSTRLAERLGARLETDLPSALASAAIVVTATSSGNCIDPGWLRPGCLVLDVGVPSDVRAVTPARDDVLILSAGYSRVPAWMPRDSFFLRLYHGIVPSCLGETMVLALENRADSFSIGRDIGLDHVAEIGRLAESHGFDFSQPLAYGQSLSPEARSQFLKVLWRTRPVREPAIERLHLRGARGHCWHAGRRRPNQCLSPGRSRGRAGMRGRSTRS